MNIGILGTGFGYHHAAIYKQVAGIDSITLFGRDRDKLKKIGEELDIQTTDDIQEVLSNANIDLIDVCLPSSLHRQYVVEALKNGKHVFCETPVALTLEDAALMLTAEKTYNKRVFVHQFIKHEMPNVYLFNLKQSGELGRLKALHVNRTSPCYEESLKHVVECCQTNAGTRLSLDAAIKSLKIALRIKEQVLS